MAAVATVKIQVDGKEAAQKLKELVGLSGELETKTQSGSESFNDFAKAAAVFAAKLFTVQKAVSVVKDSIAVAFERSATEQRLKNLTGSTEEFSAAMGAASKISNDFGISQNQAARELTDLYARLQGAGFGLKEITEIYRGFEAIAKTTGTTNEVASRTFLQLEQALSKGKLQGQDFLSVAGNMPGVLDAIATEAGVTRSELQAMGSRGEITGELIYRALARANEGFDGIESRLNAQQTAFGKLGTAVESLQTQLGNLFAPFVIEAANLLAEAGKQLSIFFGYLADQIFPGVNNEVGKLNEGISQVEGKAVSLASSFKAVAQVAVFIGTFVAVLKAAAIATALWTNATTLLAKAKAAVATSLAFITALTGKGIVLVGVALTAATGAAVALGAGLDEVGRGMQEFEEKQKKSTEEAAKLVDNFSSMPEAVGLANQALTSMGDSVTSTSTSVERAARANQGAMQQFDTAASNAKIRYEEWKQSALESFAVQDGLRSKIVDVGNTHSQVYQEAYKTTVKANQKMAQSNREDFIGPVQKQTTDGFRGVAQNYRDLFVGPTQEETIRLGTFINDVFNKVTEAMGLSFTSAFAGIKNVVNAVIRMVINGVNAVVNAINAVIRAANQGLAAVGSGTRIPQLPTLSVPAFAEGGVVNRPTLALIGEGNEREYVVPESKAPAFASNWMAGQRGNQALSNGGGSVPQINITTGPVMEFDGEKYVKLEDMERAMRATAEGVIGRLRTSSSRIALGMI